MSLCYHFPYPIRPLKTKFQTQKEYLIMSDKVILQQNDPLLIEALRYAPIYKKIGTVFLKPSATKYAGSECETWTVVHPDLREEEIAKEEFLKQYESTNEPLVYTKRGYCRAIYNPYGGTPIEIIEESFAPEPKVICRGDRNSYLVVDCDEDGVTRTFTSIHTTDHNTIKRLDLS